MENDNSAESESINHGKNSKEGPSKEDIDSQKKELAARFYNIPPKDQPAVMIAASIYAAGIVSADDASNLQGHWWDWWYDAMDCVLSTYGK
jgi:hypothetical protein